MRLLLYIFTFFISLLISLIGAQTPGALAAADTDQKLVQIRLIPERSMVRNGDEIWIAIEQSIAAGWHTYWRNPGDSGAEPRVGWDLPQGFEIGEIQWPLPQKIPYESLVNYGYSDAVILLQKLKIPENLPAGPITLQAQIEVLVCKDICIPEQGTYSVTLNDMALEDSDMSGYFEKALQALPSSLKNAAEFEEKNGVLHVSITPQNPEILQIIKPETLTFLPIDWGIVENATETRGTIEGNKILLQQKRGDRTVQEIPALHGIVAYETKEGTTASIEITAAKKGFLFQDDEKADSLVIALFFALIGGLILNLMPCVFPVLSLKALSLVKIAQHHPEKAKIHGLCYTAGVVLSFILIAGLLIALKAAGAEIGWGFQLQNPYVISGLMVLILAIGLNLLGVFEIKNPFGNVGNALTSGQGYSATFFTGVLATLVATPCTAPFMAGAIAYALLQNEFVALLIFAALGLGLAFPYLLLSFVPALQKIMPKPGAWMEKFKKILAIPMLLAALWLGWVLMQQTGPHKHIPSFGAPFSTAALSKALESENPVFVEMTAAWCITCKVNHATSLNIEPTKKLFAQHTVTYLIGDWTNQDPEITKFLQDYGRSGVPIYVYYGPKHSESGERPDPVVLPQILTPAIIADIFVANHQP